MATADRGHEGPLEIAVAGDLTEKQADLCDKLLSVEPGGECTLYFDSLGGSPYCGIALVSLIKLRGLRATGIVAGECSSAALWPFAACQRRLVTPLSVLLFHRCAGKAKRMSASSRAAEWGSPLQADGKRHGPAPGRIIRRRGRENHGMDPGRPLCQRAGVGRSGAGRIGRVQAAPPKRS